jgi:twitching motility protein PilJ
MQVVREISTQTAEGSTATSTSIAKLAALSAQLRKSVAGFRLPDYGGGTTTVGSTSSTRLTALNEPVNTGGAGSGAGSGASNAGIPGSTANTGPTSSANTGNTGKMRKASGFGA